MPREKPCTVALLRPPETSWMAFADQVRERGEGYVGDGKDRYVPAIDDWLDEFRERLTEVADTLRIRCAVEEHQLHGEELHGRRNQAVYEADILTTIDPPPGLCWYMRDVMKRNPDKRAAIAFSSLELRDRLLHVIAGARAQMFIREWTTHAESNVLFPGEDIKQRTIRRMFPFLARDEEQMQKACIQAFRYPDLADNAA